jgi:hypothetical protein
VIRNDIINFLIVFASVLLLPMIPAILIYKLLPDQKVFVTGGFDGLKLNATGAFGGYLVLLVFANHMQSGIASGTKRTSQFDTWKIHGNVRVEDMQDSATGATITVFPPAQQVIKTGANSARFTVVASLNPLDDDEGTVIQVSRPPYTPAVVPLSMRSLRDPVTKQSFAMVRDEESHTITIRDTLVLRKVQAPYNPSTMYVPKIIP